MMRNRWGVEVRRGHWVHANGPRGGAIEGRVIAIDRSSDMARAYGPRVTLEGGQTIGIDDVSQSLGPMTVARDGTVKQNPEGNAIGMRTDPSGRTLYASDLPGHGGKDWGYTDRSEKALPLSPYWQRRFAANCRAVGVQCRFISVNPLTRVKVGSPSQRAHRMREGGTSTAPTKRLRARRSKTAKTKVRGVYANPADKVSKLYVVHRADANGRPAYYMAAFRKKSEAIAAAKAYANGSNTPYVIETRIL